MTTSSSSPGPTSTVRRWPGPPRSTGSAPGVDRPAGSPVRRGLGGPRHLQRRLHPHHRAPAPPGRPAVPRRIHDNGFIFKGVYSGLYCVSCEEYYNEDELVDGPAVPDPRHAGRAPRGGELLLQAERLRATVCSSGTRPTRRGAARVEAQRGPQLHQGRPPGHLHHPDLHRLGGRGPLGRAPCLLRLVRRADQLPDRHRLRRGPGAVRAMVAGGPPPARQGHHPVPLRVVAGDVHGRRHRPARPRPGARVAARGRREDVQVAARTRSPRPTSPTTSASTPSGTTCCATPRSGPTATSPTRGSPPATTPIWPTISAICWPGWPRWSARSATGWDRPPDPTAGWPRWPPRSSPRPPGMDAGQPHLALEATWRLIRETNAELEKAEPWKADPGPAVDAVLGSALEALRIVALLVVPAMPATAETIWRRLGLDGSPADAAGCRRRGLGRVPRAVDRWRRGRPSSPGARADRPTGARRRGRVVRLPLPPPGRVHRVRRR